MVTWDDFLVSFFEQISFVWFSVFIDTMNIFCGHGKNSTQINFVRGMHDYKGRICPPSGRMPVQNHQ